MNRPARSVVVPGAPGLAHRAPIPVAAKVGPLLCSSAISGKDAATGELPQDAGAQAANAFANLRRLLEAGGATLTEVAKLTVYVSDDSVRDAINAEWLSAFPDPADRPARHIVVHDLQHGMRLQLEFIAFLASRSPSSLPSSAPGRGSDSPAPEGEEGRAEGAA